MLVTERIICPYCGQRNDLQIDTTEANQDFVADCEICCRPFHVRAECEPGEVLAIQAEPE